MSLTRFRPLAAGIALVLAAAPAAAADYSFSFAADVADGTYNAPFTAGGYTYSIYSLDLGAVPPVDLMVGDTISVSLRLDQLLDVPASTAFTFVGINAVTSPGILASAPDGQVTSSSVVTPFGGTFDGQTMAGSSCGNCIAASLFFGPDMPFSYGGQDSTITIEYLAAGDPDYMGPITLTGFTFGFQVTDFATAVPEPGTWALLLAGFGLAGLALRRRRGIVAVAA